jgi:hypothetical protein
MELDRLARIEEKQDAIKEMIQKHFQMQDFHNANFYRVRDKVLAIEAGRGAIGWLLGVLGAMVVALAGFVAWAFSFIKP